MRFPEQPLELDTVIMRQSGITAAEIDGETVLMNMESGKYYGFNHVGTRIWELLEKKRCVGDLCEAIAADYDVGSKECTDGVLSFLNNLAKHEIIYAEGDR